MPRFKAHIRDGRRKAADLEVEVSQTGLKLEDAKTKQLFGCASGFARPECARG